MHQVFQPNIKKFWQRLQGPSQVFTLQTRIYHSICIATIVVMAYVLIFSLVVGMQTYAWITAALIPLQLGLYYLSRVKGFTTLSPTVYSLVFHLFFVVSYRVSAGISGSTLLSYCLVYFCSLAIAPPRAYLMLTLGNLGIVGALLLVEYRQPAFVITAYADRQEHFIDIASTYAVNIIMILIGLGFIIRNYSKEKNKAEDRARMLDELHEEKARLISVISHDFQTPLISVRKYLDIISNYKLSVDERQMLETELKQSIINTQNLLMNLLEMTKSTGRLNNQDVAFNPLHAVEDTLKVYQDIAKAKGLIFEASIPEKLTLKGNPYLFTIVVRNIINNAVRACRPKDIVRFTHEYRGDSQFFCVSDTGPGISESVQKDILDAWEKASLHTGRAGGLGLLLAKKYSTALGGELTFETAPGSGTTFYIRFPVIQRLAQTSAVLS